MKTRPFYFVLLAVFVIGTVSSQNAEELPIPVETDNQFPPEHSESDGQSEGSGGVIVDEIIAETTTKSILLPKIEDVDASALRNNDEQVIDTNSNSTELPCPKPCVCNIEGDLNNYIVDCSGYGLTEFPTPIDPRTTILKLHKNKLLEIPQAISVLKNLKILNANDNLIMKIAHGSISELPELVFLKLANNRLIEYPKDLDNSLSLNKLEELDLGGNDMRTTLSPESFSKFKALRTLTLPKVSSELALDLCASLKETLVTVCTESCKEQSFECPDTPVNIDRDLHDLDAILPGMIPFPLTTEEEGNKLLAQVPENSEIKDFIDISHDPGTLPNLDTKEASNSLLLPETTAKSVNLDIEGDTDTIGINGTPVITPVTETSNNPKTEETIPNTTLVLTTPETSLSAGTKETFSVTIPSTDTSLNPKSEETVPNTTLVLATPDTSQNAGAEETLPVAIFPELEIPDELQSTLIIDTTLIDPKENFPDTTPVPKVPDMPINAETTEIHDTTPISENTSSNLELKTSFPIIEITEISNPGIKEISKTSPSDVADISFIPSSEINKATNMLVSPEAPAATTLPNSQIKENQQSNEISVPPTVLNTPEISINSKKDESADMATIPEATGKLSDSDVKGTRDMSPIAKVPETSSVSNDNLPANEFSLRTAVNNAPEEKVAVKNIIIESSTGVPPGQADVKIGAKTEDSKGGGGVDKSVIAVIVAGMVIIVAVITIKKNWSSIRKRFSSTPRPNERSGRNANGTTPEEVPLQDKSPV